MGLCHEDKTPTIIPTKTTRCKNSTGTMMIMDNPMEMIPQVQARGGGVMKTHWKKSWQLQNKTLNNGSANAT
jgi:hypothetical protein